ncbi:methyl-accepting chemotaxis protein [Rheinheimera sp. 4Y26]|uniref:methyl-accepting chemotaxis protein n=1 Tax=Rheinheimera sp. 4Y26 TaxID=2977811 RepID=UPI0028BDF8BF|nr:methyl-accepting chemotaxis protein [Rheinheimera sp. 4Y26]
MITPSFAKYLTLVLQALLLVVVGLSGLSLGLSILFALLLLASAAVIYWQWADTTPEMTPSTTQALQPDTSYQHFSANLLSLVHQLMPLWNKQSTLVKEQTEEAVLNLNQRFQQLFDLLNDPQQAQSGRQNQDLILMIEQSESKLLEMTRQLNEAQRNRQMMLEEIQQLTKVTEALQSMTAEVGDIAAQTNLLALNAAIEAARAGESGRGFAVVATEVRALSNRSGEAGRRIRERVADVTKALTKVVQDSESLVETEQQAISQTEQTIHGVITDYEQAVRVITDNNDRLEQQSRHVQQQLSDVIVNLQFQDRVSQILSHVMSDMDKLRQKCTEMLSDIQQDNQPQLISTEQWLTELEKTYTTLEQASVHRGGQNNKNKQQDDEITFF